ncbi:MAG TPA: phosphate ABC transporter substrate-binding protein [Kiritimatiellia bacterium]|nr:phosphate ABC transporter substrate-binding protein [Kiritimatiellia bacterium]HMO98975.1 phosphate ABC transporter substrate-binding protein [Kiritimatiellia bacterium]HMP96686.1 phosphate ABC transporter substrate-binding protein [Kiritimatiellia bacterium]
MKRLGLAATILVTVGILSVNGQKISVKGSNTFGEKLGPALIAAFTAATPGAEVELESRNSTYGIAALLDSTTDIAASSRILNEDERRLARSRNLRTENHVVGYYGIAVVTGPNHPVRALSDKQVEQIFSGDITNWKDVGGPDAAITLYIPESKAGTYLGFRELAMSDRPYRADVHEKATYAEIGSALTEDASGIGFVSLNMMREMNLQGVLINGIHPSTIAVIEGLYPYARMVRLITVRGATRPEARNFIRFVQSRDGQGVVERTGFVPRHTTRMDFGEFGP